MRGREGRGGKKKGRERRADGRRGKGGREVKGLERGSHFKCVLCIQKKMDEGGG